MISRAIAKIKPGKAAKPSGVMIKMIRSDVQEIFKSITNLVNRFIKEGQYLTVCSYHVTYAFPSDSILYSCLNVKELVTRSRRET